MKIKQAYRLDHAVSADGTMIGYRRIGSGPGLILVHGAFVSGHEYEKLAAELADAFTVYNIDRRGRRYSGPQGERYSIAKECEDLMAVRLATGATRLFGHSYGGLIALELARTRPDAFAAIAVYEPAISVGGAFPSDWLPAYKRAMEQGRELSAFVHFLKGVAVSRRVSRVPAWLLKLLLLPSLLFWEGRKLKDKLPTLIKEMEEVFRLDSTVSAYAAITASTLVMAGGDSPAFLRQGARAAAEAIPAARLMLLKGLGHNAPDLFNQRVIAERLKAFCGP
ncbi:alpha/beta fold hydrolase [Paenibacillus glycinis]|uniref:Alpha/beta fold hydrolase n=1 Tax=Paenibacillus glycinis TaxID=2697035 RepID=A0ABW9XWI1_9BACL|nr:alpha/beta hydrolase [Paenibacillus glycinis]NBD27067.1 alpha/beta fold hydrolase [Paenibacillus glycinis]